MSVESVLHYSEKNINSLQCRHEKYCVANPQKGCSVYNVDDNCNYMMKHKSVLGEY